MTPASIRAVNFSGPHPLMVGGWPSIGFRHSGVEDGHGGQEARSATGYVQSSDCALATTA